MYRSRHALMRFFPKFPINFSFHSQSPQTNTQRSSEKKTMSPAPSHNFSTLRASAANGIFYYPCSLRFFSLSLGLWLSEILVAFLFLIWSWNIWQLNVLCLQLILVLLGAKTTTRPLKTGGRYSCYIACFLCPHYLLLY